MTIFFNKIFVSLFTFAIVSLLALPFGAFAVTKSGESGQYEWELRTVPDCIPKGGSFSIIFKAQNQNNDPTIHGLHRVDDFTPPTTFFSSQPCPGGPVSECTLTFSQSAISDSTTYYFQINAGTDVGLASLRVVPREKIEPGTICFENPLSSLTFWQLFSRVMNMATLIGVAIAPVFLIFGVFRFIAGAGDPKKTGDAINVIKYTLIGVALLLLAKGIVAVFINIALG